jgi:hypothetical protein
VRFAPKSIRLSAIRAHHAKQLAVEMLVRAKTMSQQHENTSYTSMCLELTTGMGFHLDLFLDCSGDGLHRSCP